MAIWLTLMLFIRLAEAQTSRGAISGTVTDGSGAVIAGAKLVLTHTETAVRRFTLSNDAGIYRFDAVDLGIHELRVTHPGFKPVLRTAVGAEANRTTTLDVRLEVGALDAQVTVSAETAVLLARDGPLRGGAFRPREVRNLPLVNLNPISLARTLPGIIHTSGSVQQTRDTSKSAEFSVDGQRVRGNNFLLDGAENNDISFT
ncbi:MAG: carboxypeptidase-like regulatory domain-containing protein, partial [Blastocatellia bacterium]